MSGKPKQHKRSLGNLNRLLSEFDLTLTVSDFSEHKTENFIDFLQKKCLSTYKLPYTGQIKL